MLGFNHSCVMGDRSFQQTRSQVGYAANVFVVFLVVTFVPIQGTSNSCVSQCGNITIPYPFGTSPGCGLPEFELNCTRDASGNSALMLGTCGNSYQVTAISANTLIINATDLTAKSCTPYYDPSGGNANVSVCLSTASEPYVFSSQNNLFAVECDGWGRLYGDGDFVGGCSIGCTGNVQNEVPYCHYYECCPHQFPNGVRNITILGGGYCGWASVIYPPTYEWAPQGWGEWGVQLGWAIPGPSCQNATNLAKYSCAATATCQDAQFQGLTGYTCACNAGYEGDGYVKGVGCNDINECLNSTLNNCSSNAKCTNTIGSYYCNCNTGFLGDGYKNGSSCSAAVIKECLNSTLNNCSANAVCTDNNGSYYCNCANGFYGDGYHDGTGCQSIRKRNLLLVAGLPAAAAAVGLGGILLSWLWCKKRASKRMSKHQRFARRNLEDLRKMQDVFTSLADSKLSTPTLFSLKELEKATDGFANDHKLGAGGFGTVYQGTMENGLAVAVKRTNQLDTSGAQQFLNEVVVLSQVNHRNLVHLHGCCLETEVPMLVYEYVPNGNLSEHLRGEKFSELGHLSWPKRMQIAIETAEAITYLHSEANPPIYHRDVKSANILLDNNFGVKVSDFGISKLIPLELTHVSTAAQGTPGYWDPEYILSQQLMSTASVSFC